MLLGVLAAWAGLWLELLRPSRGKLGTSSEIRAGSGLGRSRRTSRPSTESGTRPSSVSRRQPASTEPSSERASGLETLTELRMTRAREKSKPDSSSDDQEQLLAADPVEVGAGLVGHVARADPLVDALPAQELRRRFEDNAARVLPGGQAGERIEELEAPGHEDLDGCVLERRLGCVPAEADDMVDLDPVLGERHAHPVRTRPAKRSVDPLAVQLAPEVARDPEQAPLLGIDDDQHVGPGAEARLVHDPDGGGRARLPVGATSACARRGRRRTGPHRRRPCPAPRR